jgi:hypothetical protein
MDQESTKQILDAAPGTYSSTSCQGDNVLVTRRAAGQGFEIRTAQQNGWIRIDEYDENGNLISENYEH